ncbi:anti-sigma factor antagonist [candidate division KSB1 bacterium]|nr:anti-sigma factor antagonist [candidate division KSB1 bacterium]
MVISIFKESRMPYQKEKRDGAVIVRIKKERFDSSIAPEIKAELLVIADHGVKNILVDLNEVDYADSSGLGALLFGLRQIRDKGGTLRIFGANSRVQNLIRIAKLEQILLNYNDEEEAMNNLK